MRLPNPFNRKSSLDRLLGTLTSRLRRRIGADKAKAGLIAAGGLAGLTAASAGVSSLRRRLEGPDGSS